VSHHILIHLALEILEKMAVLFQDLREHGGSMRNLFVDDLGINLKPARKLGMRTIKVTSEQQALNDLYEVLRENKSKD